MKPETIHDRHTKGGLLRAYIIKPIGDRLIYSQPPLLSSAKSRHHCGGALIMRTVMITGVKGCIA